MANVRSSNPLTETVEISDLVKCVFTKNEI